MNLFKAGAGAMIVAAAGLFGAASSEAQTGAPRYQVDANWPKPLAGQLGARRPGRPLRRCATTMSSS